MAVVAGVGYVAWLDYEIRTLFEGKRWSEPATVYARPLELYTGRALTPGELVTELRAANYGETGDGSRAGTWSRRGRTVDLTTRAFDYWDGSEPSRQLRVGFAGGRVETIQRRPSGEALPLVRVDPATIGAIAPTRREDRLLVQLDEVPATLIGGLLAVEDRAFHRHFGISPSGIARAALANLRAGRIVQGGSTLTQQLVKNLYLSSEQTLARKLNEAVMAVLLEMRYDKRTILETYLNEVFLAQDGNRAIHGFGLAAPYFFGRPLAQLSVDQQALLVAMVKGPTRYNPRRHPERAKRRRDVVLGVMADNGVISPEAARAARGRPLGVLDERASARHDYPAFMDLVQRHLQRDYRREDLQTAGLRVFTTLSPRAQDAAERAVLQKLEGRPDGLEAAVVTVNADSGEVTALVGGRKPQFAGFNRALDAHRPIGSLIKPAIYLAALERPSGWGLGSVLEDSPLRLEDARGETWTPRNFDREFRGDVLLVDALTHSYNIPAIRLGMDVGVTAVTDVMRRLGQDAPRSAYPSYMLGTAELSPLDVARMYQVFAGDGFRTPLRAVRAVSDDEGGRLKRYPLEPERVIEDEPLYLINHALQRVMREGTGQGAYNVIPRDRDLAGKTGTTSDNRDSWFAGFSGDVVGVAWMGRDDNGTTGLTGSTGALPLWAETMAALSGRGFRQERPENVVPVWVDAETGRRTHEACTGARQLPYHRGHEPEQWTECGRRHAQQNDNGGGWLRGWFR